MSPTGRRSVLIVIDVPPEDESRVSKELWLGAGAERYMVWGAFDPWIAAIFPAKELRAEIRKKGGATAHDEDKSAILSRVIDRRIDAGDGAFALEAGR